MTGQHAKEPPKRWHGQRAVKYGVKVPAVVIAAHWCLHFSWYLYEHLTVYLPIPSAKIAANVVSRTPVFSIPSVVAMLVCLDIALERMKRQ